MRVVPTEYQPGGAYGICPVCGFKERLREMRLRWDGLRVCFADWEQRPDTMTPPRVHAEGLPRPDTNPEPPDTFITAIVRPEDL